MEVSLCVVAYMNVDHLKVKGIGWEVTEPTACCEHGNE
jgi:hypothetical protein